MRNLDLTDVRNTGSVSRKEPRLTQLSRVLRSVALVNGKYHFHLHGKIKVTRESHKTGNPPSDPPPPGGRLNVRQHAFPVSSGHLGKERGVFELTCGFIPPENIEQERPKKGQSLSNDFQPTPPSKKEIRGGVLGPIEFRASNLLQSNCPPSAVNDKRAET